MQIKTWQARVLYQANQLVSNVITAGNLPAHLRETLLSVVSLLSTVIDELDNMSS